MSKKEREPTNNTRKYIIIGGVVTLSFLGIAAACCYFATNASDETISAQTFALLRNARLALSRRPVAPPPNDADIDALPEPPKVESLPNTPPTNELIDGQ